MRDLAAPFPPFDRADYLRRCRASGAPRELADEMADEEEAKHAARALLSRIFKHGVVEVVDEWED